MRGHGAAAIWQTRQARQPRPSRPPRQTGQVWRAWRSWLIAASLAVPAAALADCPVAESIAPGVHLLAGQGDAPSPANGGQVVNRVFLVGPQGVVVIDPGPTPEAGRRLRCAIAKVTPLPVVAVVGTHPHPENVLAALAFPEAPVYATAEAAAAMARRCAVCQQRLAAQIDDPQLANLQARLPDHPVTQALNLRPGGRAIALIPLGAAHSPGDLAVLDTASGVLVGGDAANVGELPDLHDGRVAEWAAALRRLAALPGMTAVVPGRGRPFAAPRLGEPLRYLDALWRIARERVEAPDGFVPPPSLPAPLRAFPGDPARHALNFQHALREAEDAWWAQGPRR